MVIFLRSMRATSIGNIDSWSVLKHVFIRKFLLGGEKKRTAFFQVPGVLEV